MRKIGLLLLAALFAVILAACGGEEESPELVMLEVDFEVPETVAVGETTELKATVTYGDEAVTDADEVQFEIWLKGEDEEEEEENKDNSDKIDGTNNGDGTYTLDYEFTEAGVYEMYAHTTARDLHTMPKKSVTVTK